MFASCCCLSSVGTQEKLVDAAKPKDKDLTLPGWGVWGGQGVADPMPKR